MRKPTIRQQLADALQVALSAMQANIARHNYKDERALMDAIMLARKTLRRARRKPT
jgi:hypothetical protein